MWARVEKLDRGAVQRALWEERTLIKTWAMRGTLHLLPASELPLWHAGLRTNPRYMREEAWKNYLGITLAELDQLTELIAEALHGRVMTREELMLEVKRLSGSATFSDTIATNSWGTILKPAAFAGGLCFGPSVGTRVRFTHPGSWLGPASKPMDPEEAQLAIARRFLGVYGPATVHDVARWWGGGGVASARRWIAQLGGEVCAIELEGEQCWMLSADVKKLRDLPAPRSVNLLPAFDQYVIGASRHAHHLLPGDLRARVYRPQGWISPVLLVNGMMHGVWRHEVKGSRVEVTISPFVKIPAWAHRGAEDEAERLAEFLGGKPSVVWNT